MTGLVQTSSEKTWPLSSSPLILSWYSVSPLTWARFQTGGAWPTLADVFTFFDILFSSHYVFVSALVGCWSSAFIRKIIYKFLSKAFAVRGEVGIPLTRVTPTDRPKSVRNRFVIEVVGGVCVSLCCFLCFSVGVGAFLS